MKLKTYEILQLADANPCKIVNKKIKLVSEFPEDVTLQPGDVAKVLKMANGEFAICKDNMKVIINGFEVWEIMRDEPMNFIEFLDKLNDAFENSCNVNFVRVTAKHPVFVGGYLRDLYLDAFLIHLGKNLTTVEILDVLKDGEFYLE